MISEKKKKDQVANSLMHSVVLRLIVLLLMLFIILAFIYEYTAKSLEDNLIIASQNIIDLYGNDIENRLKNAGDSLDEVLYSSSELSDLGSQSESERYFASKEIIGILEDEIVYTETADAFFTVDPTSQITLVRFGPRVGAEQNLDINQFLESPVFLEDTIPKNRWTLQQMSRQSAFVKTYKIGDSYVGVLVLDTTAMENINRAEAYEDSGMLLTGEDGLCYYVNGPDKENFVVGTAVENAQEVIDNYAGKYILVSEKLNQGDAKLSHYVLRNSMFNEINLVPYLMMILAVLTILYLCYVFMFLRKKVIVPIDELVVATKKVGEGDWDFQLKSKASINELMVLGNSFNDMTTEIKKLKIRSYEEQIQRQKVELKYLQMQIKPHFYLNAMTTIHSMTFRNKNEQIRAFVEALSEHMRYTIRDDVSFVKISEEISHVKDFVKMQEIRYADNVFFMSDVDEGVENFEIPQFLILTFIENTFKYAMDMEKLLSIFIRCKMNVLQGEKWIHIQIEDNGPGFTEEMLSKINSLHIQKEISGRGIGIQNIKKTLNLFYEGKARIEFSNSVPSGASIDIWIEGAI